MKMHVKPNLSFLHEPIIAGKVIVRPFQESDITSMYLNWLNDLIVVRFSNQRFRRHTLESSRKYLSLFAGSDNHFLAVCDPKSQVMVGTMTVYSHAYHRVADIGIMVGDPSSWGKGIGFDAFQAVALGIERSGEIRKITAGALAANVGMLQIMQKAGFEWEATRKGQELLDGQAVDVVHYAKFCHP